MRTEHAKEDFNPPAYLAATNPEKQEKITMARREIKTLFETLIDTNGKHSTIKELFENQDSFAKTAFDTFIQL